MEINGAIRDVLKPTRDEVTKNGVSVLTPFAELPPTVKADQVQLQQVILNLIINAVEAMSGMREEPCIHRRWSRPARRGGILDITAMNRLEMPFGDGARAVAYQKLPRPAPHGDAAGAVRPRARIAAGTRRFGSVATRLKKG